MEDELRRAIEKRLVIKCNYQGKARVGQPHLLGLKEGDLTLEIYQTEGRSSGSKLPQWRHFKVSDISDLTMTNVPFTAPADFNPFRRVWGRVLASV